MNTVESVFMEEEKSVVVVERIDFEGRSPILLKRNKKETSTI